jgi:HEAT repeat protein
VHGGVFSDFLFASEVTEVRTVERPDLLILKLMQKLSDSDPRIRRNAAGALRMQGSRAVAAIPALCALLTDLDSRVRNEAERAIDHLKLAAA